MTQYCAKRIMKQLSGTFDKTPRYIHCLEKLIDGKCPKHGKEINEPKDKK